MNRTRSHSGFTLIEMMIVVVIIGLLMINAVPVYQDYVRRSKMADATSQLSDLRVRMEQYYQDNRRYSAAADGSGGCGTPMPAAGYFGFACANPGGDSQAFVITATGIGDMSEYTFSIDQTNTRRTTAFVGASGLPKSCWIYRRGDDC